MMSILMNVNAITYQPLALNTIKSNFEFILSLDNELIFFCYFEVP